MKIYFTVDEKNRITPCCDWTEEIIPREDWKVGEIESPAYNAQSIPLWKYENGTCLRRTASEVQADIDELPVKPPTEQELLRADVDFLLMMIEEA